MLVSKVKKLIEYRADPLLEPGLSSLINGWFWGMVQIQQCPKYPVSCQHPKDINSKFVHGQEVRYCCSSCILQHSETPAIMVLISIFFWVLNPQIAAKSTLQSVIHSVEVGLPVNPLFVGFSDWSTIPPFFCHMNDNLHSEDNNASEDPIELAKGAAGEIPNPCWRVKSISGKWKIPVADCWRATRFRKNCTAEAA